MLAARARGSLRPCLGTGVPALRREQLSVFSASSWQRVKQELIHEAWLEKAKARIAGD